MYSWIISVGFIAHDHQFKPYSNGDFNNFIIGLSVSSNSLQVCGLQYAVGKFS